MARMRTKTHVFYKRNILNFNFLYTGIVTLFILCYLLISL